MERTDAELAEAIRAGDASAFEELYRRYRDWIAGLAFRFCGNHDDALDVLQETFTYLHRKSPAFELRAKMKTFLYPVVKHLAISRKRAARRTAPLEIDVAHDPDPPASDELEHLVDGLPEEQRETVWLRFVDGLDLKEIAGAMDVPLGTVKSRLHTALETLRRKRSKGPNL